MTKFIIYHYYQILCLVFIKYIKDRYLSMHNRQERIFEPSLFKEYLKGKFISLLDSIAGRKLLMLEHAARAPINLIIQKRQILQHQIPQNGGISAFEIQHIDYNFDQIVIILSPTVQNLKKLKELILMNVERGNRKFYPVFWPKRTMATKQFLQSANLMEYVEIKDFSFDLLPLDIDLYSLEMKIMRQLYVDDNHTIYSIVAESIHRLQSVFGRIHNIFGKGRAAYSIYNILKLKQKQIKVDQNYGDIQHLIIFDRSTDFLTPLLKQITYEGMIDQFYGISGGIARVPPTVFDDNPKNTQKRFQHISLNSDKDYIYQKIRILSINGARMALKTKGQQFDAFTEAAKEIRDSNQKANAVRRIKTQQSFLKKHLNLVAAIMQEMKSISFHKQLLLQQRCLMEKQKQICEYYQNMIAFEVPLPKVLRSMCLQSMVDRGISRKHYGRICDDIATTYGEQHIVSMTNLAKLGLFFQQGNQKDYLFFFNDIKKEMRLINDQSINHENPTDPSFAYGGYCPIFTKLVQMALRDGWRQSAKALKMLKGEIVVPKEIKQCTSHPKPAVVVYFVGGVTYGEIATIRLLGKFFKKQIIVATTHIINGESMIKELLEPKHFE